MTIQQPPTKCPVCQSPLRERSGVSQKTNKPYRFWGCSSYPSCTYVWREPSQTNLHHEKTMEALRELWTKLDQMEKKFDSFTKIFCAKQEEKDK